MDKYENEIYERITNVSYSKLSDEDKMIYDELFYERDPILMLALKKRLEKAILRGGG